MQESFVKVQAESTYTRAAPNLFNYYCSDSNLSNYIFSEFSKGTIQTPQEGFWHLTNCYIINGRYVLNSDMMLLTDPLLNENADNLNNILPSKNFTQARSFVKNNYPFIHIMSAGLGNYAHVLVDMLPKLLNVKAAFSEPLNLIIPKECEWAKNIVVYCAFKLGIELEVYCVDEEIIYFDDLILFSKVSTHSTEKSNTLVKFSNVLKNGIEEINFKKILIWREQFEKRPPIGGEKILNVLIDAGYEIVLPHQLSFQNQISMFSGAELIVGLLGAGLSNILFAPEKCRIMMIDPGLYSFFYWDLAALRGQEFNWSFSQHIKIFTKDKLYMPSILNPDPIISSLKFANFI